MSTLGIIGIVIGALLLLAIIGFCIMYPFVKAMEDMKERPKF